MSTDQDSWSTDVLKLVSRSIQAGLIHGYKDKIFDERYLDELPFSYQKWQVNVVEAKKLTAIISYQPPSGTFSSSFKFYPKTRYPELAQIDDVNEMAKFLRLDDYIGAKEVPPVDNSIVNIINMGFDDIPADANPSLYRWAYEWGLELASVHMANLKPGFKIAQDRMTRVYEKLFELEHDLRLFVEHRLQKKYGSDWLSKANVKKSYKDQITKRRADPQTFWLDELDTTILRYLDFPMLRGLIVDNNEAFKSMLGNNDWFASALSSLEPIRNRIAHVNTLSADNAQDFYRDAKRIIAAIKPEIQ
jgi:hypothetical protein